MSILDNLTINDFKKIYYRNFTFSIIQDWQADIEYNINNEVLYFNNISYFIYKSKTTNINKQPDININDWEKLATNIDKIVFDKNIQEAFDYSKTILSQALNTDELKQKGFFLLIAHNLQKNIINAKNMETNQINSKSIGGASISYNINQNYLSLTINDLSQTSFGKEYLSLCNRHNKILFVISKGGQD